MRGGCALQFLYHSITFRVYEIAPAPIRPPLHSVWTACPCSPRPRCSGRQRQPYPRVADADGRDAADEAVMGDLILQAMSLMGSSPTALAETVPSMALIAQALSVMSSNALSA